MSSDQPTPFGREMRKHFLLDANYHPLNHGGYGAFPIAVKTAQRKFQDEMELRPDVWFQRTRSQYINEARKAIAEVVHAPIDECVFLTNTSLGMDTIIRNLDFKSNDAIIVFATVYYSVGNTLSSIQEMNPVQTRKVEYTFPISHDEILHKFFEVLRKARSDGLNVRATILDTIVSTPGVRFPFERLVKACKDEGILSIVDGAHGVGHIPLNLGEMSPDFFVSNCHKWLYTPRGCALFYVPKRNQHLIRTSLPTGPGYVWPSKRNKESVGLTPFENLFDFVATSDDTPFMCVSTALKFRKEVCGGEDAIYAYLQKIAHEGGDKTAEILGTEVMQEPNLASSLESEIRKCALVNVRLPLAFKDDTVNPYVPDPSTSPYSLFSIKDAAPLVIWLKDRLISEFDTYANIYSHGGWMWARLSGQIYLEVEDFEWIGHVLADLCDRAGKGEWSQQT